VLGLPRFVGNVGTVSHLFIAVRQFAIFCHRWMGVAFYLLFTWWFVSGVFMMYCDFPQVSDADRLRHAQPLEASRIRISPEQAYKAIGLDIPPDEVHAAMFDGRPAYWFGAIPDQTIVYADDGTIQDGYPSDLNLRTAAAWAGRPAAQARVEDISGPDQWTVGGQAGDQQHLFKYSWPDGQQVYVSPSSGQVMQYTTRWSRIGAYVGPVAHWLYFTPLRRNGARWSRIVIWASGIGTLMALSGLVVGVLVYSPSKRYRYLGEPASIPYSGTKRLHMIFGLFFGIVACTWAFSGMLSMDPFPSLAGRGGRGDAGRINRALRGEIELAPFSERLPAEALALVPPNIQVKELELAAFVGDPVYLAHGTSSNDPAPQSWIVPVHGAPKAMLESGHIVQAIRKGSALSATVEVRTVTRYEAYYADRTRNRDGGRPLPVLYLRIANPTAAPDSGGGYYIDPRTARVVARYSPDGWFNRWLYHGLHSLDFPWLYNYRPAWDIVVLLLLAGGTTLCVTSAILAWKLLQRKIGG